MLRVTVDHTAADGLLAPARTTVSVAGVSALVLLALGVLMHLAARRARQAEHDLRQREALAELGEMAAVLAHEIRTPVGSIKGNAQLVAEERGEGDRDADPRVEGIVREAARLERLVNGMLQYARPAEPRRVACDVERVATRAAEIVAPRAAERGVDLMRELDAQGATVSADPDQLQQVLVNLIQNAVDAGSDPGATGNTVVIRVVRGPGGGVTAAVLDSGPGLSGGAQEAGGTRALRPFFTTKAGGTGLGLAVASRIVEQHGGRLALSQREEGGVEARFTLPRRGVAR